MRILHTADLHLGRQLNGIPLDADHAAILDQIVSAITSRSVDVLVIAGDIFDRAAPPTSAVRQFNRFLARVASETEAAVVMIAGNAWLTAIILALVLVLGIGAVELLSQAAQPLSDVMIGEPMCIQP
ncbi:hypothetical protein LCGC14_2355310, partial [marine sediment metagenome]